MSNYPTSEEFLNDPRAKELRQICLDIAGATDRILHDPNVDEQTEYATLEQMNGRLIELGITPHFKSGLDETAYQNPVTMAEYVAGQWIDQLGRIFPSERSIMPIVQEHSEASAGSAHIMSGKNLPSKAKDFIIMRSFVNVTYRFLDADGQ